MFTKAYMVTASGESSKKSGLPYSIAKAIVNLNTSQFLSDKDTKFLPEFLTVGTIIKVKEEVDY